MKVNRERLRKKRLESTRRIMKDLELDALICNSWDNLQYVTDARMYKSMDWFCDYHAAVLPLDGKPILIGRDPLARVPEDVEVFEGWIPYIPYEGGQLYHLAGRWASIFSDVFEKLNLVKGRIGLDYMPFHMYEKVKREMPEATFVPALDGMFKARSVKNEEEVKLVRKSADVLSQGVIAGLDIIESGVTERQIFSKIVGKMFELGSEMLPWNAICFSSSSRTQWESWGEYYPSDRKLKKGEAILIDTGSVIDGYHSDIGRSPVVGNGGKRRERAREVYEALFEAYNEAMKEIRPGVKASEVDATCRRCLREAGYPVFQHSLGHGIGLKMAEYPLMDSKEMSGPMDMELKAGMVLCIEPGIFQFHEKELDLTFVEDTILVTETGSEVLTKIPYSI